VYVDSLCRELPALGVETVVVAPGAQDQSYSLGGLRVRRFTANPAAVSLEDMYGRGDAAAAEAFERILAEERPDLVHQHSFSPACSVDLMRRARRRGVPVVFTFHGPGGTCLRDSLLLFGGAPCDGYLTVGRCAACALHGHGIPKAVAQLVARIPPAAGRALARWWPSGRSGTALAMSSLVDRRLREIAALFAEPDRIVVPTPWVREMLLKNAVPSEKIVLCRHGVRGGSRPPAGARRNGGPVRIAHLGRLDPLKGTAILVRAIRASASLPVALDVYGIAGDARSIRQREALQALAAGDSRIRFLAPVESASVVETLSHYDLVAVPSQVLETGPLVVLEAFAAGVPVIGSALGGIADKVQDGVDGLLISPAGSADAWRLALERCTTDAPFLSRLRNGVRTPRSMAAVAQEMRALYLHELEGAARWQTSRARVS
jgi:glycosyltransferase involved in cell wall biosynthesis